MRAGNPNGPGNNGSAGSRVFITSVRNFEIFFLPGTGQIVSCVSAAREPKPAGAREGVEEGAVRGDLSSDDDRQ